MSETIKHQGMTVEVTVKDLYLFQRLLEIYGKIIVDERINENVRQEYFDEYNIAIIADNAE